MNNWHSDTIDKFATLTSDSLRFIIADATAAARIGSDRAGQYLDEVNYAAAELQRRLG
jgi:hypothetical protein